MAQLGDLIQLFGECLPYHYQLCQQRKANLQNYNGQYSGDTISKMFVPLTSSMVEDIYSKIVMSFFQGKRPYNVNPEGEEDIAGAASMQVLLYQQTATPEFLLNFAMWIKYALMHSLSFVKMYWHKENKPYMTRYEKDDGTIDKKIINKYAIEEPRFSVCDMDNLFFHPQAPYLFPEKGNFIIDQYFRPMSWVLKQIDKKDFNGSITEQQMLDSVKDVQGCFKEDWSKYYPDPFSAENELASDPLMQLVEYHTDEEYYVYVNLKYPVHHEVRKSYFRKIPYLSIKDIYLPHDVQGRSEIEILEDVQLHVNTTRNMRIDNMNLGINMMWLKDRLAGISNNKLVSVPGNIISADDIDGLKPLPVPPLPSYAFTEEQVGRQDASMATGATDYWRGASPERRESASTYMQAVQQANPKFELKAKIIGIVGLQRLIEFFGDMNIVYMSQDRVIKQLNKDGTAFWDTITPYDIPGRYNYRVNAVTDFNQKAIKQQGFVNAYRYLMNRPTVDPYELDRKLLERLDFDEYEIDLVVRTSPERMARLRDPEDENFIIQHEGYVTVHPKENFAQHFESHRRFMQEMFNTLSAAAMENLQDHLVETEKYMKFQQETVGGGAQGAPGKDVPLERKIPVTGLNRQINPTELVGQS